MVLKGSAMRGLGWGRECEAAGRVVVEWRARSRPQPGFVVVYIDGCRR